MIDPLTIVSLGASIGIIILSFGGAVRLARSKVQAAAPPLQREPEPDLRAAMLQRLDAEIRRPYAPQPRVKK